MTRNILSRGIRMLLIALLSVGTLTATAQKTKKKSSGGKAPFEKGDNTLGLFVGFGVDYNYYGSVSSSPAFGVTYDHGIINDAGPGNIGIGGVVAFKTAHYNYASGGYKATWTNVIVGVRGTYHLTLLKDKISKLDPYGGVTLGFRIASYRDTYYDYYGSNPYSYNNVYPIAGLFVGATYHFTDAFGAYSELGYDISFFRIGLNFHF